MKVDQKWSSWGQSKIAPNKIDQKWSSWGQSTNIFSSSDNENGKFIIILLIQKQNIINLYLI